MDNFPRILGNRIRTARARLSLTQQDLAKEAGFSAPQIISQIEKGEREVKAWELAKLAQVLQVEVFDFLSAEEPEPHPAILWRAPPRGQKGLIEAEFIQHCQQYALLEDLCEIGAKRCLPSRAVELSTMDYSEAEQLGEEICEDFKLGARPASSLITTLEDTYGVKIWYRNLGEKGSAASVVASFGAAILMNLAEAPWRRNFSFGHELFHLLTWQNISMQLLEDDPALKDRIEKRANAFASALLLPADDIEDAFRRHSKESKISYVDIISLAREFDVSTAALLYRLRSLGHIDEETVESLLEDPAFKVLDRMTMAHHWRTPPEIPERFVRLGFIAYKKGRLSRARLAQFLKTSLFDLTEFLAEYNLDDNAEYQETIDTAGR